MPDLLCIGMGYVAKQLATSFEAQGWRVRGTSRKGEGHLQYSAGEPSASWRSACDEASHILISLPPDDEGCPVLRDLGCAPAGATWIGYLSTTGVYGDHQGQWVDESAVTIATESRAQNRLLAEQQWQAHAAHIFRLSGIYGAGRSALDQVRAGKAQRIDAPDIMFSRIHVEDIAQALLASIQAPAPGEIYNLADDCPCPASEVVGYACELLDSTPPPLIGLGEAALSPMALSFYKASRRVANHKMKQVLGVQLRYPSYREGLRAILETGTPIA